MPGRPRSERPERPKKPKKPVRPRRKRCSVCGVVKPGDEYHHDSEAPDGLRAQCKECRSEYMHEYGIAHREERREADRIRRARDPEHYRQYEENRREEQIAKIKAVRKEAEQVYGGKCAKCGATEELEFDHPNGDGFEHRKIERPNAMLLRITREGRLTDFELQLLCAQCHLEKTREERALMTFRKVSLNDKRRMKELREQGMSITEIGEELDFPYGTVSYHLRAMRRKDIE